MGILDIFKGTKFKNEITKLQNYIEEIGGNEGLQLKAKIQEWNAELSSLEKNKKELEDQINELHAQIKNKNDQIIVLDDELLLESFALYKPKFNFLTSEEYKEKLDQCRERQKEMIRSSSAVKSNENWTVNNSKTEGKKMVNDMKKLILRSFNNECDFCVDHVKFHNIEMSEKRIEKSFDALNKLGKVMQTSITPQYKALKFDELRLAHEYQVKKQEEKEAQKKAREELREQQKLEQEIRQAREKIAKERKHFSKVVQDLTDKLTYASSENEKSLIQMKLDEVRSGLIALEQEEKVIDYREKSAKAGYVYIISNIGAFGENVFKIGMTRRLEPNDRIDELGDASVPFYFDIHAMIFSENAPTLEAKLHQHFKDSRINKLNYRKEFFRASIEEIEKVVRENYDKVVDIVKEPLAEQYRESILL